MLLVLSVCCDLVQGVVSESIFPETAPPGSVRLFSTHRWCFEVVGQCVPSSEAKFFILLW